MTDKKHGRRRKKVEEPAFRTEKYDTKSVHEERKYGLYWYAWLWKIVRPVMIFLCSLLIVIGVVTTAYNRIYDMFFAPVDTMNAEVITFEVENGDTVAAIGANLESAGLLRNDSIFKYIVQFRGLTAQLSYGSYQLSPTMNVMQIIDEMVSGSQTNERVITIVPGWTCEDIADYLVYVGAITDRQEFLKYCNNTDLFVGSSYALANGMASGTMPKRKYALEGYLQPDTYRIFLSATPESIINKLLTQNNTVVDKVFYADNTQYYSDSEGNYHQVESYKSGLTMDQTIILASMIEKEASNDLDYARVSAVFHNRLKKGIPLESDPTATYLTGENKLVLSQDELLDQNAYNTYAITGLPAGPICNPSIAALNAAMNPDLTYIDEGYMYFCAAEPGSGLLVYAKTKDEHEANVAHYRPLWEAYDEANRNQ